MNTKKNKIIYLLPVIIFTSSCSSILDIKCTKNSDKYLSTKSPYLHVKSKNLNQTFKDKNLTPISIVHLGRHTSRHFTKSKSQDIALSILKNANQSNMLKPAGKKLLTTLKSFREYEKRNYGNITSKGVLEQKGIAKRLFNKFHKIFKTDYIVKTRTTHKKRTQQTRDAFISQLKLDITSKYPNIKSTFNNTVPSKGNDPVLRFFDNDKSYKNYKKKAPWIKLKDSIIKRSDYQQMFCQVAKNIFADKFISKYQTNKLNIKCSNIKVNQVIEEFVTLLYQNYQIENNLKTPKYNLKKYFSEDHLNKLEFIADLNSFYKKGPGFVGNTATYKMAIPLLKRFIDLIDLKIKNRNSINTINLHFAHAETVIPLVTLLKVPNASTSSNNYPTMRNRWKGSYVAPMSANIQLILFKTESNNYRIRILHNEKEVILPIPSHEQGTYSWIEFKKFYLSRIIKLKQ